MLQNRTVADLISADERHKEIASLLATGFLRYWLRRAADGREKELDVPRTSSDSCVKPTSEGETQ